MPSGSISKIAILADPKEPAKVNEIRAAINQLIPAVNKVGIEADSYVSMPVSEIQPDPDVELFVVLGGDGTMIHFAGRLSHLQVPFYGLNYGNVGFMMNNPRFGLDPHAQRIKKGNFLIREFPLLTVEAVDHKGRTHKGVGLNDIYLQRMTPQSCMANIRLDGSPLNINPLLCDGVIVATPLGSTAYSFNVTGSLVSIEAQVLTLTPVAAQRSCPLHSVMLPMTTVIEFDILEPLKRRVQVVSDGQSHGDLTHAKISISPHNVKLCFEPEYSDNLSMRFINKACSVRTSAPN